MKKGDDGWHAMMREYDDDPRDPGEATVELVDSLREYIRVIEVIADGSYDQEWGDPRKPAPPDSPIWGHLKVCKKLLSELEECEVCGNLLGTIPLRR
jgi:hypothetical protein